MHLPLRIVMVFVDGLGIGDCDPALNPVYGGACPHLRELLEEQSVAIDARLGLPGLPQSATGQTALLTGVNAAEVVGRHVEGFPGRKLREIVEEQSIFKQLGARGLSSTFANAYYVKDVAEVRRFRLQSVTTVATLSAFGMVRDVNAMLRNAAVYQDITRESLRTRGYDGPLAAPSDAAMHLATIAEENAFTLFEYFQTDRAGHTGDVNQAVRALSVLDAFLGALVEEVLQRGLLLVLTSDHGNIEDLATHLHTTNPVPLAAVGPRASFLKQEVQSIVDVTPALLHLLA
jgi:2,3-bisphosphoglycerate-independent phosphoglycerate mutase